LSSADAVVEDSHFSQNLANSFAPAFGGTVAIGACEVAAVLRRCEFTENLGGKGASGVNVSPNGLFGGGPTEVEMESCLFVGNGNLGSEAVVYLSGGSSDLASTRIRNSTFTSNIGQRNSVLTANLTSSATLEHCTVAGNMHSQENGTAVYVRTSGSTVQLKRSVIAGNRRASGIQDSGVSPDVGFAVGDVSSSQITSEGYNFVGSATGVEDRFVAPGDQVGTNGTPLDARLASLADYGGATLTMPPRIDSPLVDAIPAAAGAFLTPDARGVSRPQGNPGDIGAIELPRIPFTTWNLVIPGGSLERDAKSDSDRDGLANVLEYLLGEDPIAFSGNPLFIGEGVLEVPRSVFVRPGFFKTAELQFSTDLAEWQRYEESPEVFPETEGQLDRMIYRYPLGNDGLRKFFRMAAEAN
jgi:hypothetical protein